MTHLFKKLLICALTCVMAGCASPVQWAPVARADIQDIGFAEPALARSVNAFLGQQAGGGVSGGLSALNEVDFELRDLHETAAGVVATWDSGGPRTLSFQMLVGQGRTEVYLPKGVDVLVDPITVTAATRFAELSGTLQQRVRWSKRMTLIAEMGHRRTASDVSLRSALLARDDTGIDRQSFAGIGMRFRLGKGQSTTLDLGLRHTGGSIPSAKIGLGRTF